MLTPSEPQKPLNISLSDFGIDNAILFLKFLIGEDFLTSQKFVYRFFSVKK